MIALGILLSVAGIGFFCWLLFTLPVSALPFFAGMTVGPWAYDSGAGAIGSFLISAFAAGLLFGLGHRISNSGTSIWVRFAIHLAFAAPAGFTRSHAQLGPPTL